jgi:ribosomal protein L29
MTIIELKKQLSDMQQKLAALRLSRYTKQSKNVRESKIMRQRGRGFKGFA